MAFTIGCSFGARAHFSLVMQDTEVKTSQLIESNPRRLSSKKTDPPFDDLFEPNAVGHVGSDVPQLPLGPSVVPEPLELLTV